MQEFEFQYWLQNGVSQIFIFFWDFLEKLYTFKYIFKYIFKNISSFKYF